MVPDHLWAALLDPDDPVACSAAADWLEERGAPEAADVRLLASAAPVIPAGGPGWLLVLALADGLSPARTERVPAEGYHGVWGPPDLAPAPHHAEPERLPMACGPWWCVELRPDGVFGRVHHGTPVMEWALRQMAVLDAQMRPSRTSRDFAHWPLGFRFPPPARRDEALLRRAFDVARRQLIGLALREDVRYDEGARSLRREPLTVATDRTPEPRRRPPFMDAPSP